MADTVRTKAYLLASIFQDGQPPNSITPQDMRDYVVSAFHFLSENVIYIRQKSDLPASVVDGFTYVFDAPLSFANGEEIVIPALVNVAFRQSSPLNGPTYTGTGTFVTCSNVGSISMIGMDVTCSGSGTLLNFTGATGFPSVSAIDCSFVGFASLGILDSIYASASRCTFIANDAGVLLNDCPLVVIRSSYFAFWNNTTAAFVSVTGSTGNIQFNDNIVSPGSNEYVLDIDSAVVTDGIAISGNLNNTDGRFFDPTGLTESSVGVTSLGNSLVPDSTSRAHITFQNNATATVITTTSIPVKIAGTFITDETQRVTATAGGRLTYNGLSEVSMLATIALSPVIATGNGIACAFYLMHGNDTSNTVTAFADAGGGQVLVTAGDWSAYPFANGDRVKLYGAVNYTSVYTIANVIAGVSFRITATYVAETPSAVYWSKIIAISRRTVALTNGTASSVTMIHDESSNTSDWIEIWAENNGTTADLTITDCIFIWRK